MSLVASWIKTSPSFLAIPTRHTSSSNTLFGIPFDRGFVSAMPVECAMRQWESVTGEEIIGCEAEVEFKEEGIMRLGGRFLTNSKVFTLFRNCTF